MNPKFGYPLIQIMQNGTGCILSLEDIVLKTLPKTNLKKFTNSLLITINGHCFCERGLKQTTIVTPWYERPFHGTYVEYERQIEYCNTLSHENAYVLLWHAVNVADSFELWLREKGKLGEFTEEPPHSGYMKSCFKISKALRSRLKKKLEERGSIIDFFEYFRYNKNK